LLDTHALIWFLEGDPRLSSRAKDIIGSSNFKVFVSIASLWEIAIKNSVGKLGLSRPFEALFPAALDQNSFALLPISIAHLEEVARLPFHHRDPFDRLLIAQARVESLPLITIDSAFSSYPVQIEW
jgi:PIN domain nuclease of toxin-antitoxin system